eukprot:GEMP01055200.1.p1 GENE.GEMP01055200.1~~GEMP01055200.1.p1  ORF type:complete len:214 (+),score=46.93 GEMP01055200.1:75-716(+)
MAEEEPVFDFGKKRKKVDKDKKVKKAVAEEAPGDVQMTTVAFEQGEIYDYDFLLHRLQEIMNEKNPTLGVTKKYTIKPPKMVRVGSKKVGWVNFAEICHFMQRQPEHVMAYFVTEFATEGNLAGDGQFILKGHFTDKKIEPLLRKYIKEYVTCGMCKSANTTLQRDNVSRLQMVVCSNCTAQRSCAPIKGGFQAVGRGIRKKARNVVVTQVKA